MAEGVRGDGERALSGQGRWGHVETARLLLDVPRPEDAADLHTLHADPAVWTHFPSGVHTDPASGARMVEQSARQFAEHGLGYWSVREAAAGPDGPVVGRAGCCVPGELPWWNLYYRLSPAVQGRGFARELARAALEAARAVAPERPVMAFLLEHNIASRRTAQAVGLRLIWRGRDRDNPDPEAVRLVFLDRDPSTEVRAAIEASFLVRDAGEPPPAE